MDKQHIFDKPKNVKRLLPQIPQIDCNFTDLGGSIMAYPMGEAKPGPLQVYFDRRLKLEFHGSDISSDGGLLPYRELDDALGLTELGGEVLSETRRGKNTRPCLSGYYPHPLSVGHLVGRQARAAAGALRRRSG